MVFSTVYLRKTNDGLFPCLDLLKVFFSFVTFYHGKTLLNHHVGLDEEQPCRVWYHLLVKGLQPLPQT